MADKNLITFSLFNFSKNKFWAFKQVPLSKRCLNDYPIKFSRFLGTGGNDGFSMMPNFHLYGLLCVWNDKYSMEQFFHNENSYYSLIKNHSEKNLDFYLQAVKGHGSWHGISPFSYDKNINIDSGPVTVLTRASINISKLHRFWKYVPNTGKQVKNTEGHVFSVGVGEWPIIEQATFSLWENYGAMVNYAYGNKYHKRVIALTKKESWYKEELFCVFKPYKIEGDYNAIAPSDYWRSVFNSSS
ncbi:MAG TPA: spheroidene monooxygenase [Cyclobacteriaceae bacterium]